MYDPDVLLECMVESDANAVRRARRARRSALLVSVALQLVLVTGLVLLPLVASGERLVMMRLTPIPPYPRSPVGKQVSHGEQALPQKHGPIRPGKTI